MVSEYRKEIRRSLKHDIGIAIVGLALTVLIGFSLCVLHSLWWMVLFIPLTAGFLKLVVRSIISFWRELETEDEE